MSAQDDDSELSKTSFQAFGQNRRRLADGEPLPPRLGLTAGVLALSKVRQARGELRYGGTDAARGQTVGEKTADETHPGRSTPRT